MSCFEQKRSLVEVYTDQLRFGLPPQVEACSHSDFERQQKPSEPSAKIMTRTSALVTHDGVTLAG